MKKFYDFRMINKSRRLIGLFAAVGTLLAARALPAADAPNAPEDILRAHIDDSVSPSADFFEYANGGWLKKNPIPASESGWGIGDLVDEEIYARMRTINEDAAKTDAPAGSDARRIGDFWTLGMDEAKAKSNGLSPISAELDRIDAVHDLPGAIDTAMAELPLHTGAFLSFRVSQDDKKSDEMAVFLYQGGLGLPNRDFYFRTDENSVKVREGYRKYVQKMLELTARGRTVASDAGDKVIAFENALAKASRPLADLRDPEKNYNKMPAAEVRAKLDPAIDWPARLSALGLSGADTVIVGQPEFYSAIEKELRTTPVAVLKDYLRFHLVDAYAPYLTPELDSAHFDFRGRLLAGQEEQRPRWKRVLDAEENAMGMVLGRLFVQTYFPERSKKRYSDLVEAIRNAYRERIEKLEWMSPETRARALDKLAKMTKKVGYPDKWKDYSKLAIGRDSYAANMMAGARWRFDDMIGKYGKPVDRTEWGMTPQTYNAYYNPSNNEIVLPAAIFTIPGVTDDAADDAMVYGYAAASTIGHEMTHGFDDEGRQYDVAGNLADWWTKEDASRFQTRAELMVSQFDGYEPLPTIHINGKACLGENIADLGGVLLGLDAFKKTEQYRKGEKIAGFTPLQRYFLGYALGWLEQSRKETLARRLLSDVHAPPKWRVNGPMANVAEFDEAFGVKPGDGMWRPENVRVHIW